MQTAKLEQGVRLRGMVPEEKILYRDMTILVADGYRKSGDECPFPHYFTFYAVGRSVEKMDIGSFAIYAAFSDPLGFPSKKNERVAEAIEAAKKLVDQCHRVKDYNG